MWINIPKYSYSQAVYWTLPIGWIYSKEESSHRWKYFKAVYWWFCVARIRSIAKVMRPTVLVVAMLAVCFVSVVVYSGDIDILNKWLVMNLVTSGNRLVLLLKESAIVGCVLVGPFVPWQAGVRSFLWELSSEAVTHLQRDGKIFRFVEMFK